MRSAMSLASRRVAGGLAVLGLFGWSGGGMARVRGQEPAGRVARSTAGAPRAVPEGLNFANGLLADRRYGLAAEEFERFLQGHPAAQDAADATFGLARARLFLGQYKEARRHFEEFLRLAPEHPNAPTARFRVGEASYFLRDLPAARRALDQFTSAHPKHPHLDTAWPYLGEVCFGLNDLPAARRAFERALADFPEGPLAHRSRFFLGRVLAAAGDHDEALKVLNDLAQHGGPEWADKAWDQIGRIDVAAGRFEAAVEAFRTLETVAPRSPLIAEARLQRAEALARLGRLDQAEALLRPLADGPNRSIAAKASYSLGERAMERGQPAEARALWDGALKRFPDTPLTPMLLFRSAEALLKEGQPGAARARFLKVAEGHPKDPWADRAWLQAARISLEGHDPAGAESAAAQLRERYPASPLRAEARLIAARAAQAAGKPKVAIARIKALLAEDQPGPELGQAARYYLGLAYRADGQGDKSSAILDDLAKTPAAPIAADAQFLVGQGHFEAGRFAEAIAPLEKYLKFRQGKPEADRDVAGHALAYLAVAQAELGRGDASDEALQRLATEAPGSQALAWARLRLGESALNDKQFDRAADLVRPVAEGGDSPWKARALADLGWSEYRGGHPDQAAAAFAALIEADPENPLAPEAALMRGRALEAAKQPEPAATAYEQAASKYPATPQGINAALARARLLAHSGHPDPAAKAFEQFLKDHPEGIPGTASPDQILDEWGWALLDAKRPDEADAVFRRIIAEHPDGPRAAAARVQLAESAYQAKKPDEAAKWLEPLVADGSTAPPESIQAALFRLGTIRFDQQDWPGAARDFGRLVADFPDGAHRFKARFWKAEALARAGQVAESEAEFAALAAATGPDAERWLPTARLRRIECLVQLERWRDVLEQADALLKDVPDFPQVDRLEYARGRALQSIAPPRFNEARSAFAKVIKAAPGSELATRAQLMRGETFFLQKNYREALREYHKVDLTYDAPQWQASALLEAGKVYELLDQWSDAAEIFEKLRSKFPTDPHVPEATRRLEAARRKLAGGAGEAGGPADSLKED